MQIRNLPFLELTCTTIAPGRLCCARTQVTDRAAAALSLKADGEEVNELRLFVKGQFADVRAAANQGAGRGRLSYTTGAGHTLCLSCDQPLAPLKGHSHEPLAPQGRPNINHADLYILPRVFTTSRTECTPT